MASNSNSSSDRPAFESIYPMPTTFDAGFRGLSGETIRRSNGDGNNESISSLQPFDYRYTRRVLQHHGSSESSLASAPSSYSHASTNDAGVPNEPLLDNFYEPVNHPINFNIHPFGEDIYGSSQLDSGLSQTRSDQSIPETEILRQQLYHVTNKLCYSQELNKRYHQANILLSARLSTLSSKNDALQRKLNEYARWFQYRQQWPPGNTVASAQMDRMAYTTYQNGNARTVMSPTSPRGPGAHRNQRTPPPYPDYSQRQSNTQVNVSANSDSISNHYPTGSPGLIERKTFRNVNNGPLEFLKAEHLSTLESDVLLAEESSKSVGEQDWSGLDYKAGSKSLISLLSEGTGIGYPSQSDGNTHTNSSDSDEDTDLEDLQDEQSTINAYYPIDPDQKLPWKIIIRSETCYHNNKKLSIALMDAECNLPKIPQLKIYFRVNLTSNKGDWALGKNTTLFHVAQCIPINQVFTFTLLNDHLDDFVINLSVCTEIEPNDAKISLGVLSANPLNCLNGVRSYEVTSDNVKTWNQVLFSLKKYKTKSADLSHLTRRNTNTEEETNVTYRDSIPIKKLELETDTSNPSSYVSCIDQEIILQNRTHSYGNLAHVGVESKSYENNDNDAGKCKIAAAPSQMKEVYRSQSYSSLKHSKVESNDEDDRHRYNSSTSKLSIKAHSQTNINSIQNQKISVKEDPKETVPAQRSKSKETLATNENSRSSRRSFKSFLRRNHKKKHPDTTI